MPPPDREGDVAAHRKTRNDGTLDPERVEHRNDVVRVPVDRVGARDLRFTEAAEVGRDAARARHEPAELRCPQRAIVRKAVQEHDGEAGADIVVRDVDARTERDHRVAPPTERPSNVSQKSVGSSTLRGWAIAAANAFAL